MENSNVPEERKSVPAERWKSAIFNDVRQFELGKKCLLRHPKHLVLVECEVVAIYADLSLIHVKTVIENDEQYVLSARSFVLYNCFWINKQCEVHHRAEAVPKNIDDDEMSKNDDDNCKLVLVQVDKFNNEPVYEAARRIPQFDDETEDGVAVLAVFELISGKCYTVVAEDLADYNFDMVKTQKVHLAMESNDDKMVFTKQQVDDDTVINALYNNVKELQADNDSSLENDSKLECPIKSTINKYPSPKTPQPNDNNGSMIQSLIKTKSSATVSTNNTKRKPYTPTICLGRTQSARQSSSAMAHVLRNRQTLILGSSISPINSRSAGGGDPDPADDDEMEDDDDDDRFGNWRNNGNNGNNNGNNGNNGNNNNNFFQALNATFQNLVGTLSQRSSRSVLKFKTSDIKLRYWGKNKDGKGNQDLIQMILRWEEMAEMCEIPKEQWYPAWSVIILQGPAKKLQTNDKHHGNDIFKLWGLLYDRFPPRNRLPDIISNIRSFTYKPRNSMDTHISIFVGLIDQMDDDIRLKQKLNAKSRLPLNIPDKQAIYQYLLNSVRPIKEIYNSTIKWEFERNEDINNANYKRGEDDVQGLMENLRRAAYLHYPQNEMTRRDVRKSNYHFYAPYPRVTSRRGRWQRNRAHRARGRDFHRRRFGQQYVQSSSNVCFACKKPGHRVQDCQDRQKKKEWCLQNKACYRCASTSHRISDCPLRRRDRSNEEGGASSNNRNSRGGSAIRYQNGRGEHRGYNRGFNGRGRSSFRSRGYRGSGRGYRDSGRNYRGYHRGGHARGRGRLFGRGRGRHQSQRQYLQCDDQSLDATDNGTNEQPITQRIAYQRDIINNDELTDPEIENLHIHQHMMQRKIMAKKAANNSDKLSNKSKEHQNVQSSCINYNMEHYGFEWNQVPTADRAELHLARKYDEGYIKASALVDTGSSITTITPGHAKKIVESTEFPITKSKAKGFKVENGGQKEEYFSGDYIQIPVRVIGTENWANIKFYIMPHNHCSFSIILGLRDMKYIGYDIATKVGEDVVLFKHQSQHSKSNYVESKEQIIEKLQDYGDEFGDQFGAYSLLNKVKHHQHIHQSHQKEAADQSDEKEDGRLASHQ